jgi:plastocyanin
MKKRPFLAIFAILMASPALAGDLDIRVNDAFGRPVPDAVVTVHPSAGIPKRPVTFPWAAMMVQQNIAFAPHVLIVPVGATVRFPNKDKVRHHIYSFSKPARFEIKLFGKDETRSYTFTSTGAVALGCNIHDSMSGFIKVVDTPFAAKTDAQGHVHIAAISAGSARITVWHPLLRGKDNELVAVVPIGSAGTVSKTISIVLRGS